MRRETPGLEPSAARLPVARQIASRSGGSRDDRAAFGLDADAARELSREIVTFVPHLVQMLRQVVIDPRVPQSAKVEAAAALGYLVSPKNRLTNLIPVVGQLDDVAVLAFAFRRLVMGAGEPILREHWRGSDRAFAALMGASAALATPRGMIRNVKIFKAFAESAFDKVNGRGRGRTARDDIRIVEGEVVDTGTPPNTA
jgi:uncharacterized membrane protein YkvA (DUF1232 family)